jgi:uncharacterized protein (DUF111 family)
MGGMTRHAWLDVSAGVAGDMLLAACVDAGADLAAVEDVVRHLVGADVALRAERVTRGGQRATRVVVEVVDTAHHAPGAPSARPGGRRHPRPTRDDAALAAFAVLARAEGHVHGVDPEEIHFHEAVPWTRSPMSSARARPSPARGHTP